MSLHSKGLTKNLCKDDCSQEYSHNLSENKQAAVYLPQNTETTAPRERKHPPTPNFQPKVIQDLNPNFRINSDMDVCRSHLSQNVADTLSCQRLSFRQVWYNLAVDRLRNANNVQKSPIGIRNGRENEKVIRNPHADPDNHQKLITSRGSPLAHAWQLWSTSVSAFVSYPVYSMTGWQNDHITSASLAGVKLTWCLHVHQNLIQQ